MRYAVAFLALILTACQNGQTTTGVYTAAVALTAADRAAIQYVTLPLCGPTHPKPLCSEPAVSAEIKRAAQVAHDAVKKAEMAGDNASLAAANAAIVALAEVTPKN